MFLNGADEIALESSYCPFLVKFTSFQYLVNCMSFLCSSSSAETDAHASYLSPWVLSPGRRGGARGGRQPRRVRGRLRGRRSDQRACPVGALSWRHSAGCGCQQDGPGQTTRTLVAHTARVCFRLTTGHWGRSSNGFSWVWLLLSMPPCSSGSRASPSNDIKLVCLWCWKRGAMAERNKCSKS